ncbi:hypothetical protein C8Q80DRAFT_1357391 [Daedaleopsis nitida]|nr:hypothetical protein C8Q80DRAFT_1357391 [Daedaleopsis nitida]
MSNKPDSSARLYISHIEVCIPPLSSTATSRPRPRPIANRVREFTGLSDDINYQFGGKYVWLVPQYTENASQGVTGFEIVIQGSADGSMQDLAKGAGGDYRYLLIKTDVTQERKVTQVTLLRQDSALSGVPAGWDGATIDINKGRGKTYLYLLWKTAA